MSPSPWRDLLRLSWPGALTLLLDNAYRFNDLYWVGQLGGERAVTGQAAVSVAGMVSILAMAFYQGVATGFLAQSSRVHGAGESGRARKLLVAALIASVSVAAIVAIAGLSSLDTISTWLVPENEAVEAARLARERLALHDYLRPILGGGLFLCLAPVVSHGFLARKNAIMPLLLEGLAVASNFGLNAVLVVGVGEWEGLGVAGAGYATVLSRILSSSLGLWLLARSLRPALAGEAHEARSLRELLLGLARIASPVTLAIGLYSVSYQLVMSTSFAPFGAVGRAAFGAGFALEGLAFCTIWGVAMAGGSLVGNELGARRPDEAERWILRALGLALAATTPFALAFYFTPGPLASILVDRSTDAQLHAEVCTYLRILAFSQLAVAVQGVVDTALASAGHTLPTSISTGVYNLSRIPLCYFLAIELEWGLPGIWWGINISTYAKAATSWIILRRGRWKTRRV